jgi:hypothetical protein
LESTGIKEPKLEHPIPSLSFFLLLFPRMTSDKLLLLYILLTAAQYVDDHLVSTDLYAYACCGGDDWCTSNLYHLCFAFVIDSRFLNKKNDI